MVLTAETAVSDFLKAAMIMLTVVIVSLRDFFSKSSLPFDLACNSTNNPQLYS